MSGLVPVVGYVGGKRRLLPVLRPYFDPYRISLYAEPFAGMGAVYLDLRARGYRGPAILAESNEYVRQFWQMAHGPSGVRLLREASLLEKWPHTEDGFWRMMSEPCDGAEMVARGLWLTNVMYANLPPTITEAGWVAPRGSGTKLKSAAKWNKTFPWAPCVTRLDRVIRSLEGLPCDVFDDGIRALGELPVAATVFADPPYEDKAGYGKGNGRAYVSAVFSTCASNVVFTECASFDTPIGWRVESTEVVARQAGPFNGARGKRREWLYVKEPSQEVWQA